MLFEIMVLLELEKRRLIPSAKLPEVMMVLEVKMLEELASEEGVFEKIVERRIPSASLPEVVMVFKLTALLELEKRRIPCASSCEVVIVFEVMMLELE